MAGIAHGAMELANVLASRRAEIVERFVQSMREEGLGETTPRSELIAHVSFFLADVEESIVASDRRAPFEPPSSKTARVHGRARHGIGFDLAALVREYGHLRRAIVSVAMDHGVTPTPYHFGVIATCIDVALAEAASGYTAQRDAELLAERDALARERARLEDAVAFREDMVSIVSHDLRSPLTAISLIVRQLERLHVDEPTRRDELLATIQRSTDRMARLISDLLDVATIEAGTLEIEAAPTSVASMVAEAIDAVRPLGDQKSIRLVAAHEHTALYADVDRDRILQVLANLLGNALKFTPEGGEVRVETRVDDGDVRVSVHDTGPGIAPDLLPHVFDRFVQGKAGKKRGAGLGLAIAKGIVEAHGRTLTVESELGRGATFSFTVPLVQMRAATG